MKIYRACDIPPADESYFLPWTVESMEPGIRVLVERGYIRIDKEKTGGRPTEKIYINPELQKVQKGSFCNY